MYRYEHHHERSCAQGLWTKSRTLASGSMCPSAQDSTSLMTPDNGTGNALKQPEGHCTGIGTGWKTGYQRKRLQWLTCDCQKGTHKPSLDFLGQRTEEGDGHCSNDDRPFVRLMVSATDIPSYLSLPVNPASNIVIVHISRYTSRQAN
jgi:hypothetical protein